MPNPIHASARIPLLWVFAVAFFIAAAGSYVLARSTGMVIFAALAGLGAFALLAVLGEAIPPLPFRLRTLIRAAGIAGVASIPASFYFLPHAVHPGATDSILRLAAVSFAVAAFAFHFLGTYSAHVVRETPSPLLSAIAPFARLLAAAHTVMVATLLVRLYAQRSWFHPIEVVFNLVTAILIAETILHAIARWYQPARLRSENAVFARSIVLPTLFGESGPVRSLGATLEKTFGVRLADTWLVQLARMLGPPLLACAALGLWASTAITQVPIDCRGVLMLNGAFAAESLPPGAHLHRPWPWGRVAIVPTERIQELSLGFERDLAGPVLWAEKHFEGEQNLLVGQGEELLTINAPIHYRVRDAVAYLRRVGDARAALEALGYRELLNLTNTHTAFGLMTSDRVEITGKLRANLQRATDQLGLGLEIVFVGLKDVHPPVAVAPSYQDVVSAEEHRAAMVDNARTYAVQAGIAAEVSAALVRRQAETSAVERRARALGETARFLAPLAIYREQSDVFVTRRRLETLEAALADIRHLVLVPRDARSRANFYIGLDASTPFAPAMLR